MSALCQLIESSINITLGSLNALEPQVRSATKLYQAQLKGALVLSYTPIISLIGLAQETLMMSCAIKCMDKAIEENDTRQFMCKLIADCPIAIDLIFDSLKPILVNNPLLEDYRYDGEPLEQTISRILFDKELFEKFVCQMTIGDLIAMGFEMLLQLLQEQITKIEEYIEDNARLDKLDRQIKNAYEDFRELTKPAEKFLIEVQGFLNLCPLVCDLGDGIIEELGGKEDLLEVLDTIQGVEECYTAYSPENAHLGFEGMRKIFSDCVENNNLKIPTDECDFSFKYLCDMESWLQEKFDALQKSVDNMRYADLRDCLKDVGGYPKVAKESEDGFFDSVFDTNKQAEMTEKEQTMLRSLFINVGSPLPVSSYKYSCFSDDLVLTSIDLKELDKNLSVDERNENTIVPSDSMPNSKDFIPKPLVIEKDSAMRRKGVESTSSSVEKYSGNRNPQPQRINRSRRRK